MGEMIGGYLVVLRYASLHETSIQWDQLTLKKGSRAGGGQKKVSAQTTRDKRGEHGRHTDQDIRGGVQCHEPRSIGARSVQNGRRDPFPLRGERLPALGGRKKDKTWKSEVPAT